MEPESFERSERMEMLPRVPLIPNFWRRGWNSENRPISIAELLFMRLKVWLVALQRLWKAWGRFRFPQHRGMVGHCESCNRRNATNLINGKLVCMRKRCLKVVMPHQPFPIKLILPIISALFVMSLFLPETRFLLFALGLTVKVGADGKAKIPAPKIRDEQEKGLMQGIENVAVAHGMERRVFLALLTGGIPFALFMLASQIGWWNALQEVQAAAPAGTTVTPNYIDFSTLTTRSAASIGRLEMFQETGGTHVRPSFSPDGTNWWDLGPEHPAKYVVFIDSTDSNTIKARNGVTGVIDYRGTDPATVINNAMNNLTASRTWQETVVVKGKFTISSAPIKIPSYTLLDITQAQIIDGGVPKLPNNTTFAGVVINANYSYSAKSANSYITVKGGIVQPTTNSVGLAFGGVDYLVSAENHVDLTNGGFKGLDFAACQHTACSYPVIVGSGDLTYYNYGIGTGLSGQASYVGSLNLLIFKATILNITGDAITINSGDTAVWVDSPYVLMANNTSAGLWDAFIDIEGHTTAAQNIWIIKGEFYGKASVNNTCNALIAVGTGVQSYSVNNVHVIENHFNPVNGSGDGINLGSGASVNVNVVEITLNYFDQCNVGVDSGTSNQATNVTVRRNRWVVTNSYVPSLGVFLRGTIPTPWDIADNPGYDNGNGWSLDLGGSFSTLSTSYVDVTSSSATIITSGKPILIGVTGTLLNNTLTALSYLTISEDGTDLYAPNGLTQVETPAANYTEDGSFVIVRTPTAGSHTYKLRMKVNGGTGYLSINGNAVFWGQEIM